MISVNLDETSASEKTRPCNEYPFISHFHRVKLGYAGVYLFFLFMLQNKDCGYTLEPNLCK